MEKSIKIVLFALFVIVALHVLLRYVLKEFSHNSRIKVAGTESKEMVHPHEPSMDASCAKNCMRLDEGLASIDVLSGTSKECSLGSSAGDSSDSLLQWLDSEADTLYASVKQSNPVKSTNDLSSTPLSELPIGKPELPDTSQTPEFPKFPEFPGDTSQVSWNGMTQYASPLV